MKKEKSSKKRKLEAVSDESAKVKKGKVKKSASAQPAIEANPATVTKDQSVESNDENDDEDQLLEDRPSKKRKASIEEIEVDIAKPEPPSKKALRLLKKGKPLPPSKSGAESPEPAAKEKKAGAEKRSEHGIWIGNLPFTVSKDDLRKFFTEYSDITEEQITRVHMTGPQESKSANKVQDSRFSKKQHNTGFAYVDFSTVEAVGLAVELSEQLLGGRRVLIKDNKSFEGRPERTKAEIRQEGKPPSRKIFLGNLSFDTTEDSLKEHFEKCGPIGTTKIATFEDSGKCKGYAWITFEELEAAESAVKGYVMIKEEIEDEESEPDEGSDSESENKKPKVKATKTRKWWVNKIKGRALRMEFAEDAQVRYKKRYGKDGTKAQEGSNEAESEKAAAEKIAKAAAVNNFKPATEYRTSFAPRLTGGIVESKGKKITF